MVEMREVMGREEEDRVEDREEDLARRDIGSAGSTCTAFKKEQNREQHNILNAWLSIGEKFLRWLFAERR